MVLRSAGLDDKAASLEGALTPARVVATRQEVYAAVQSAIAAAAASGD